MPAPDCLPDPPPDCKPTAWLQDKLRQAINNREAWLELLAILNCLADGISQKAGREAMGAFSGNPKKATVTFTTQFSVGADYEVTAIAHTVSDTAYVVTIESQTAAGFVLNVNRNNIANLDFVSWIAIPRGD